MYSDADLDTAVSAGALTAESAARFRAFMTGLRLSSGADEEHFRLLTGFNDIFVSIAVILILVAIGFLWGPVLQIVTPQVPQVNVLQVTAGICALFMALISWGLAEYFTRKRRMALPSIVLFVGFIGAIVVFSGCLVSFLCDLAFPRPHGESYRSIIMSVSAASAAVAAYVHWRRFMVPITIAACTIAGIGTLIALALSLFNDLGRYAPELFLIGGLATFALAIRWDMSDRDRITRRSDVAFWLHLFSAPMIVHPVFAILGLSALSAWSPYPVAVKPDIADAGLAVAIYVGLAIVAVAVDRRALLVSALLYVLYAIGVLVKAAGSLTSSFALAALVIGSGLLLLSAFWHRARRLVLRCLPRMVTVKLPTVA